jgi:uncharacterized protein
MQTLDTANKRRLLSVLSHAAIFFSWTFASILVPLAILFVSDDAVVKNNAKESINFHFSAWLIGGLLFVVLFPLHFITFGLTAWLFGGLGALWVTAMTVLAVLHALSKPDEPYRYPFIFHIL